MTTDEENLFSDIPDLTEFYTDSGLNDPSLSMAPVEPLLEQTTHKLEDHYHHLELIGQGGMKEVYSALDIRSSRKVAIAILHSSHQNSQREINLFIQEARITANLEHPNIVPIHEIGVTSDHKPFFSMKILEGETLANILRKLKKGNPAYQKKYSANVLLNIFLDVCNAVEFAHSKQIIHLDLKPENIQVGKFGEVLVIDWGLAKLVNEDEVITTDIRSSIHLRLDYDTSKNKLMTRHGTVKGSPGYMAPEQALGSGGREKGFETDVYALGAILYSILTYERPTVATTYAEILTETVSGQLIPPRKRAPQNKIPTALNAVTIKAMSKKKEERYPTVHSLKEEVTSYQNGYATLAESASMLTHLSLFYKRHRIKALFTLASIIISIMLLSLFLKKLGEERDMAKSALIEFQQAQHKLDHINETIERERAREWKLISSNSFTSKSEPLRWQLQTGIKVDSNYILIKSNETVLNHGKLIINKPSFEGITNLTYKKPLTDKLRIEFELTIPHPENGSIICYFRAMDSKNKIHPQQHSGYSFVYDLKKNTVSAYQFTKKLSMTRLDQPLKAREVLQIVCQVNANEMSFWIDGKLILKTAVTPVLSIEGSANCNGISFINTGAEIDKLKLFKLGTSDIIDLIELAKEYLNEGNLVKARNYLTEVIQNSASKKRIKTAHIWLSKVAELEKLTKTIEEYQEICKKEVPDWENSMLRLVNGKINITLDNSKVTNINFMKKLPHINGAVILSNTMVKFLSPLENSKIQSLRLSNSEVRTLVAIRNSPLKQLFIRHTKIHSLEGIQSMKNLDFLDMRDIKLKEIQQLKQSHISQLMFSPNQMPKGWEKIIQSMPELKYIATSDLEKSNQQTAEQFWKKYHANFYKKIRSSLIK
jgi:serine/threonine-protein kinase